MEYIAHINGDKEQSCVDHCRKTAQYAKIDLESVGLGNIAYLAGLIHDMGKFTEEFTDYIRKSASGEKVRKGSVIHTFAGVRMILIHFHPQYGGKNESGWEGLTSELIATAVGSHHGLFDEFDECGASGFVHRIEKQPEYDERAENAFLQEVQFQEIEDLFRCACEEVSAIMSEIQSVVEESQTPHREKLNLYCFYMGMIQRLINSAVIDGDRRDTAEFMGDFSFSDRILRGSQEIWNELENRIVHKLDHFPQDSEIQCARRKMSDYCGEFASKCQDGKIYRMNLPTGGGKTITSLRFSITHASKFNKKRIFFVIPLLSILDQNASEIRKYVGNDDLILEHHSNIVQEKGTEETCLRHELLVDTWDSPILITTLVQFLNTLFAGSTSSVRRLEALSNSVIVFDEVQSVPKKMLSLFTTAINFLAKVCHSTVILCSATQPTFEINKYPMLISDAEMIPQDEMKRFKKIFKRTEIKYNRDENENLSLEEICNRAVDNYRKYHSVLIVCNTKKEARELYYLIKEQGIEVLHLSTSMCMKHRREIIQRMKQMLNRKISFVCVSTQLIEAGVDISFGSVIRFAAGMDSIVQAAGRCNRNGECKQVGPVEIVFLQDEGLNFLKDIRDGKNNTGELLASFRQNPEKYDNDLMSEKALQYYYKQFFKNANNTNISEYVTEKNVSLFDLISYNSEWRPADSNQLMGQAFASAGSMFKVFEEYQHTVLVPCDEKAENLIVELTSERAIMDLEYCKGILEKLKIYTVQLFDYEIKACAQCNAIYQIDDGNITVLKHHCYDDAVGFMVPQEDAGAECIFV